MSEFTRYAIDTRPISTMTPAQVGVILGLEDVLQHAGLILTCPRCAADGYPTLKTDNSVKDDVWKIDCQCRRRRVNAQGCQPMQASGDLLLLIPDLLTPLSLDVRCPSRQCLTVPLTIQQTRDGVVVTCPCGGTFQFKKTAPVSRPH